MAHQGKDIEEVDINMSGDTFSAVETTTNYDGVQSNSDIGAKVSHGYSSISAEESKRSPQDTAAEDLSSGHMMRANDESSVGDRPKDSFTSSSTSSSGVASKISLSDIATNIQNVIRIPRSKDHDESDLDAHSEGVKKIKNIGVYDAQYMKTIIYVFFD